MLGTVIEPIYIVIESFLRSAQIGAIRLQQRKQFKKSNMNPSVYKDKEEENKRNIAQGT